jgi:hypothetical protein
MTPCGGLKHKRLQVSAKMETFMFPYEAVRELPWISVSWVLACDEHFHVLKSMFQIEDAPVFREGRSSQEAAGLVEGKSLEANSPNPTLKNLLFIWCYLTTRSPSRKDAFIALDCIVLVQRPQTVLWQICLLVHWVEQFRAFWPFMLRVLRLGTQSGKDRVK